MTSFTAKLPAEVRARALGLGAQGATWLADLDDRVASFESDWSLKLGDVLAGGTEALVIEAQISDAQVNEAGAETNGLTVLKLGLPGSGDIATEVRAYQRVSGDSYAKLLRYDLAANVLLLERLGSPLASEDRPIESQIHIICETLQRSWTELSEPEGFMTGQEKAEWLAEFIERGWQHYGKPCAKKTAYRALDFCKERAEEFSLNNAFLIHGDAHSQNLLAVPGSSEYRFVDPDGLCAEKACDLAVPMREWSEELIEGSTAPLARRRCNLLATLTGEDEHAIWQWGYMERISTALVLLSVDRKREAGLMLAVAEKLTDQPV
ncbi:MAG: streptomycin 6-kinase [Candidatus Azotimanducaceae bacterium]